MTIQHRTRSVYRYTLEDWRQKERDLAEQLEDLGDYTDMSQMQPFKNVRDQLARCRQKIRLMEEAEQDEQGREIDQIALEEKVNSLVSEGKLNEAEFWYNVGMLKEYQQQPYDDEGELV